VRMKVLVDGTAYEVDVEEIEADSSVLPASPMPPERTTIQSTVVPTAVNPSSHSDSGANVDESRVCRSPVAGIVMRVHVQAGDELQLDDLIVVLEAMKMETRIGAPVSGRLKSVKVAPGDAVRLNQILTEFE